MADSSNDAGPSRLPGTKHKVIGLVSGGKDSCFNLMHCIANGHDMVAIATLQPEPGIDELDSHMYQSVGTQLLPYIAEAMGLPLYTGYIQGKAVERGPEYGGRTGGKSEGTKGDETEDLTRLLEEVMTEHPEATALSSGAILSNYQRIRIEHVCSRLGLVSLSYLWQSQQIPLLESMFASGLEAILVKVAGVGLGIDAVGRDLQSMMPTFRKLERDYGSHPAGEGGEYETLTLSTPLFSHRLKLLETDVVVIDPEPYPVAYLRVGTVELEKKEGWIKPSVQELRDMLGLDGRADGLDEQSREALEELGDVEVQGVLDETLSELAIGMSALEAVSPVATGTGFGFSQQGRWFAISVDGSISACQDVGMEVSQAFDQMTAALTERGLSLPIHAAHITLLLSSMSLFQPANEAYKTYFGSSPPSRATVAVPLPVGQRIRIEVVVFDDQPIAGDKRIGGRQALHVQGLSYWAPANIGPYSQAVIVNERVHIAGQIPLIPASLTLPDDPTVKSAYPHQAILALQHVGRIVNVLRSKNSTGGGWIGWGESCVGWWARPKGKAAEGIKVVTQAWTNWAEENEWAKVPVIFVRALELPKGALVEYQVNLHTGRRDYNVAMKKRSEDIDNETHAYNDDNDDDDDELEAMYINGGDEAISWEMCQTSDKGNRGLRAILFINEMTKVPSILANDAVVREAFGRAVSVKIYHRPNEDVTEVQRAISSIASKSQAITMVPVLEIHDRKARPARVGIEIFGV